MLFERGNFQDIENTNNNAKFLLPVMSVLQNMKKKKKKKKIEKLLGFCSFTQNSINTKEITSRRKNPANRFQMKKQPVLGLVAYTCSVKYMKIRKKNWKLLRIFCFNLALPKTFRSSQLKVSLGKGVLKMQQIYRRKPMPKCDFNKVALQLF